MLNVGTTQLHQDLTLEYRGTGLISGSYSGSIKDPYYQYAYLNFYPSSSGGLLIEQHQLVFTYLSLMGVGGQFS